MSLHRLLAIAFFNLIGLAHAASGTSRITTDPADVQTFAIKPYVQAPNGSANVAGREWLRCSLGQQWNGSSCTGQAKEYTFEELKTVADTFNATGYGGKRDWRMPTVRELASLIHCSSGQFKGHVDVKDGGEKIPKYCADAYSNPPIDARAFPQMPSEVFWSSSPYAGYADGAWVVDFFNGGIYGYSGREFGFHVRLVR